MTYFPQPPQADRSDLYVVPLKNSAALRTPAFGGKSGQSGAIIDPRTNRIILTESAIEKRLVKTLLADRKVKSVREQAAVIPYIDALGHARNHTIDFIADLEDGEVVGLLAKDEHAASKHNLRGFAEHLAGQTSRSVANRLRVVTSRDMPEWHVQNVSLLVSVQRDRRTHVDDQLRLLAPQLSAPIKIGDLSTMLGGGQVAFRPIARALLYGTLTYLGLGKITPHCKVMFSGEVMPDMNLLGPNVDPTQAEPPVLRRPKNSTPKKKPRASRRTL